MDRPTALADLPGVVESTLPAALPARLPVTTPPAPWTCRVRAVLWVQRGVVPLPASSPWARRTLPLVVGAVVDYLDSPVGAYREVFAGQLLRPAGRPAVHVPFLAVDSLPSVHGGRVHWGLPKAVAAFHGDVGTGRLTATGDGWSVEVDAARRGLPVPLRAPLAVEQVLGRAAVGVRGRGRLTAVRVRASGPTLTGWLGQGTHVGVVYQGRLVVGAPRRT